MLDESCTERQELSRRVSNAVQAVYKARKLYDSAKEAKIKDTTELQAELTSAHRMPRWTLARRLAPISRLTNARISSRAVNQLQS